MVVTNFFSIYDFYLSNDKQSLNHGISLPKQLLLQKPDVCITPGKKMYFMDNI